jgi:hypothetical protein
MPMPHKIALGIFGALLVILAIVAFVVRSQQNEREENSNFVNSGVTQERAQTQGRTIENVEKSQKPVTADERQRVCSKYDRNCAGTDSK